MYLDARGLVALWREGLLAQAVLKGKTRGYTHHPQLLRFQEQSSPVSYMAAYLRAVHGEALSRGYRFALGKISRSRASGYLTVPGGQLEFEWRHLMEKLRTRDPARRVQLATVAVPLPHPLFRVVPGDIAHWEKGELPDNQLQQVRRKRRAA